MILLLLFLWQFQLLIWNLKSFIEDPYKTNCELSPNISPTHLPPSKEVFPFLCFLKISFSYIFRTQVFLFVIIICSSSYLPPCCVFHNPGTGNHKSSADVCWVTNPGNCFTLHLKAEILCNFDILKIQSYHNYNKRNY